jgi:anti-sigma-K factor RskA
VAEARSALLLDKSARAGWLLTLARAGDGGVQISVAAQPGLTPEAGRDYELWALPSGGKPVSLGLLPQLGRARLTLEATRAALLAAGGLAVSVEPMGGSPTGQPTGEVRYQGTLAPL